MTTNLWNLLKVAPAVLGASFLAASGAQAQTIAEQEIAQVETQTIDRINSYSQEGGLNAQDQLTSVFQLRDVPTRPGEPGFWAFDALKNLVERYGCIAGYPEPDGTFTFRGDRTLTRYEFAAALNACLQKIELLVNTGGGEVTREDLQVVYRLMEEFSAELATLRGRVDGLEARVDEVEANQFSTTTKLKGEVIFAPFDSFGDRVAYNGAGELLGSDDEDDETETAFGGRARLSFDTSFTGKDKLRTRLQFLNLEQLDGAPGRGETGTESTRLGFDDVSGSGANEIELGELYYRFPIGDKITLQVFALRTDVWDGQIETLSPFESSGSGSISRFGRFNPVYRNESNGAGFTGEYEFSDSVRFQFGYAADEDSNEPGAQQGIFNGSYLAVGQLVLDVSDNASVLVGYVRSFNDDDDVSLFNDPGTDFANEPFGDNIGTEENAVVVAGNAKFGSLTLYGTFAASFLNALESGVDGGTVVEDGDNATAITAALGLQYKGLGGEKNVVGFIAGIQPYITNNDAITDENGDGIFSEREDDDLPVHLELYYRIQVNKFIRVTPGVFAIINPEGSSENDTIFVGTVRTTFKF